MPKYQKASLHKVTETQCRHLTMTERNELLKYLQIFEELFDVTLGTCKKSYRLWVKMGYKGNMLATIPSTEGTWGNVQKVGWPFGTIRSPWSRKYS